MKLPDGMVALSTTQTKKGELRWWNRPKKRPYQHSSPHFRQLSTEKITHTEYAEHFFSKN